MPSRNANRLIAGMWTLAGLLAWTAVGIRYFAEGGRKWPIAAAGFFCIALGIGSWTRRSIDPVGPANRGGRPPSP